MEYLSFHGCIQGSRLIYVSDGINKEAVQSVLERARQQSQNIYDRNLSNRSFQATLKPQNSYQFILTINVNLGLMINREQAKQIMGEHQIDLIAPLPPYIYASVISSVSRLFFASMSYLRTAIFQGTELWNNFYGQIHTTICVTERVVPNGRDLVQSVSSSVPSAPASSMQSVGPVRELPSMTLHEAVANGNVDQVRAVLTPQNVNSTNAEGKTPLHLAVSNEALIELLISGGADLEIKDHAGHTPLAEAARQNQALAVDLLLAKGAQVNTTNQQQERPLHIAAAKGYVQVVLSLLKYCPHLNARDGQSRTPFLVALSAGKPNIADELAQKKCDITVRDSLGNTGLHYAAMHQLTHWMDRLIKAKLSLADRNQEKKTPLHLLAASGSWDKTPQYTWACEKQHGLGGVFSLVSEGATKANLLGMEVRIDAFLNFLDPSTTPLGIEFILQHQEDPVFTAKMLKKLVWHCSVHLNAMGLRFLFQKYRALIAKTDITDTFQSVLNCETIANGPAQLEIVKILLDNKADVNSCTKDIYGAFGVTPLHMAAQRGNLAVIQLLLSRGADVRKRTSKDKTPADVATTDEIRDLLAKAYHEKIRAHSLRWFSESLRCFWSDDYDRHLIAVYHFDKESISDEQYAAFKAQEKRLREYSERARYTCVAPTSYLSHNGATMIPADASRNWASENMQRVRQSVQDMQLLQMRNSALEFRHQHQRIHSAQNMFK